MPMSPQKRAARTIGHEGYRKIGTKAAQTRAIRAELAKAKRHLAAITKKVKIVHQSLEKIAKNTGARKPARPRARQQPS
jgi:hypothetical protein